MNFRLPPPSLVVAIVAMAVATTGTVTTAALVTGRDIKNNSVHSRDIQNNTVKSKDIKNGGIGLSDISSSAAAALKGNTGATGPAGPAGPKGDSPATAYARVAGDGSGVEEARSSGVTDAMVSAGGTGLVCFNGLGFTPKGIQATVDWLGGSSDVVVHATLDNSGSCPGTEQGSFRTVDASTGSAVNVTNVYVQFIG